MPFDDAPTPDERARAIGRLTEVRRRANRRRRARLGAVAAAGIAILLAIVVPLALSGSNHPQTVQTVNNPPAKTRGHHRATSTTSTSTTTTTTAPPSTATTSRPLPVSVESDTQMKANGNDGPSSSILVPASCRLNGDTVTATGSYQGGFAPQEYQRSGDVAELYVYSAPASGYPQGVQLANLSSEQPPPIGGSGTWKVSVSIDTSLGQPKTCQVAAQPTHDMQLAPSSANAPLAALKVAADSNLGPAPAGTPIAAEAPDGAVFYASGSVVMVVDGNGPPAVAEHVGASVLALAADSSKLFVVTPRQLLAYSRSSGNLLAQWSLTATPATPTTAGAVAGTNGTVWVWTDWATDQSGIEDATVYVVPPGATAASVVSRSATPGTLTTDGQNAYFSTLAGALVEWSPAGTQTGQASPGQGLISFTQGQVVFYGQHGSNPNDFALYLYAPGGTGQGPQQLGVHPVGFSDVVSMAATNVGLLVVRSTTSGSSVVALNMYTGASGQPLPIPGGNHVVMSPLLGPSPAVLVPESGHLHLVRFASAPASAGKSGQLPISVESNTQMKDNGNNGPSSSILVPTSCRVDGNTVTATGRYRGGLVPQVYERYGDVVELYVYTATPLNGNPQGNEDANLDAERPPALKGTGSWTVSVSIDASLGRPASCQVAAQPTHNEQLAP